MGTRALIHVKEGGLHSRTLTTIYRQYDGYFEGLGNEIKQILFDGRCEILNGYGDETNPQFFNGMGCLAAYLVSKLKTQIGNVYLYPTDLREDVGEEFTYTIFYSHNHLYIKSETETYSVTTLLADFNAKQLTDIYTSI